MKKIFQRFYKKGGGEWGIKWWIKRGIRRW
jgi:hypothetical protein